MVIFYSEYREYKSFEISKNAEIFHLEQWMENVFFIFCFN